jgi:hypothetical protein
MSNGQGPTSTYPSSMLIPAVSDGVRWVLMNRGLIEWGSAPNPGIYRFVGKHDLQTGRPDGRPQSCPHFSRRSGSIPGEPYPPLKYHQHNAVAEIDRQWVPYALREGKIVVVKAALTHHFCYR